MNHLFLLADEAPFWSRILQPDILALMVPISAIVLGITYSIVLAIIRHRERMAKIEHGIDPDANENRHDHG
ncbi:MAG TPA: hypothetical protein VMJ32_08620 [Pirellulales bacterium]|nr:hypothetical protein [Pirellulales bacterium]